MLIKAFKLASDMGLNGELIIAGDGNLATTCRTLRARSKYKERISMLGPISAEQGATLRKQCDIFAAHNCKSKSTGQVEAFGVSIIEAMAAGLPVITGRSGGVVESVVDGKTGFLVTPGDVEEQARRL